MPLQPQSSSHPSTPTFASSPIETPPDTPYLTLRTPAIQSHKEDEKGELGMEVESDFLDEGDLEEMGLGFGDVTKEKGDEGIVKLDLNLDLGLGHSASEDVVDGQVDAVALEAVDSREIEETEYSDEDSLRIALERLEELDSARIGASEADGWGQRDEIARMVKSLLAPALKQLPFLHEQLQAQKDTIHAMQQQSRLSAQLVRVERDRHAAERAGWQAESRALMNVRDSEIAAGVRPNKLLDLDVGYHQELEAANKRLEMDNRLMAPRLSDTQRQIDKLVTELRHLRSNVLLSTQPLNLAEDLPPPPAFAGPSTQERPRSSPGRFVHASTTMGDARTEHLLLAARKVRAMRQIDDRVGRLTLEELKRGGVVGPDGGLGYSEGYGGQADDESDAEESDEEDIKPLLSQDRRPSQSQPGKGKGKAPQSTPLLPRTKRVKQRGPVPPTTPTSSRTPKSGPNLPETTPGGSMFNDLLRAAEMATRPGTPSPSRTRTIKQVPKSAMSATRSTTRTRAEVESGSEHGSPVKRPRREIPGSAGVGWARTRRVSGLEVEPVPTTIDIPVVSTQEGTETGAEEPESALDILAQASQLDVAQSASQVPPSSQVSTTSTTLASAARFGGMLSQNEPDREVNLDLNSNGNGKDNTSDPPTQTLAPAIDLVLEPERIEQALKPVLPKIEDHQIDPALISYTPNLSNPIPTQIHPYTNIHTQNQINTQNQTQTQTPQTESRRVHPDTYIQTPTRYYTTHSDSNNPFEDPMQGYMIDPPPGAYASPTGAAVPGLGKYVHLSSSMPARRVRSPYLKWTVEEDELLARAVAMHGEKWDLVSKGVPTRSYHQVRQRWLRKTGAFDKKMPGESPHGASNLGGNHHHHNGMDMPGDDEGEEREETSPTPVGGLGAGKLRRE